MACERLLEPALLGQHVAETEMGVGVLRIGSERFAVGRHGKVELEQLLQDIAPGVERGDEAGPKFRRPPQARRSVVELSQLGERRAQIEVGLREMRIELEGAAIVDDGLFASPELVEHAADPNLARSEAGLQRKRAAIGLQRGLGLTSARVGVAHVEVSGHVARIVFEGLLIRGERTLGIASRQQDVAAVDMRAWQRRREADRRLVALHRHVETTRVLDRVALVDQAQRLALRSLGIIARGHAVLRAPPKPSEHQTAPNEQRFRVTLAQTRGIDDLPFPTENMIRNWLDATEAVAFAKDIARDVDRLFPLEPQKVRRPSKKLDLKNRKRLDQLVRRTHAFAREHPLNVYKKGKLLNTLKWSLRESGHEEALIDEIVALLAPALTSRPG